MEPTRWRRVTILEGDSLSIPLCVRDALAPIIRELQALNDEIAASDRVIIGLVKTDANARRLMSVPGIGPITASAIAASVPGYRRLLRPSGVRGVSSDWQGQDRTPLAVRSASDACQKWETDISENCRSSAPMLSSSIERLIRMGSECGRRSLWKPAVMRDGSIYGSAMAG